MTTTGCLCQAISTHTLTWSVTSHATSDTASAVYFNSHAHVERDLFHVLPFSFHLHFNSHAHVERDTLMIAQKSIFVISTHTLTWSVTPKLFAICLATADFNSHAHVERDTRLNDLLAEISISTHTLTWSVTPILSLLGSSCYISTHTLTWSVTILPQYCKYVKINFNSHAHVERDCLPTFF